MDKQSVNTDESPTVRLEVHGNLHLKGWDDQEVHKADTLKICR
jgi:ssRNA-specific RNase YbeY (16S rRNA maturation enzyme)